MLLSDDRLTRRAIGGDQGAFTAIFERYQAPLYRYCLAILGDREDAEDALQSTMVKVLRALPGEKRRIELKPWLYRIAHNESVELIRRRRPSEELDAELLAGGAGLAEEASGRERLRHLLADIGQLPERQRGTLVMRELGGLGFEEIGAALGTSAAVARQTLYEARLGLREMDAGREMGCDEVTRAISDADGRVLRRRDIRAHLRTCEGCRRFREEIGGRERDLAALSPLPAALAAGLLQTVLGGAGAGTGTAGGSGAALGAGAAKTIGAATLFKGAATVAAVAVIGVGAADRGGLIHVGLPGDGSSSSTTSKSEQPAVQAVPAGTAASGAGADGPASAQPAAAAALDPASRVPQGDAGTEGDASGGPAATPGDSSVGGSPAADPQLPSASAHGQETAAAHKASGNKAKGNGSAAGKASKPAKPSHPEKPAHSAKPAKPVHPEHPSKKPALSAAPPAASGAGATAKPMPAAPAHEGKP